MADTPARTAQELADECKRLAVEFARVIYDNAGKQVQTSFDQYDQHHARMDLHAAIDRLAALASQAPSVEAQAARLRNEIVWVMTEVWPLVHSLTGRDCVKQRFLKMSELLGPAQAEPTMADAIAAGDGTLHGAIDCWQQRASEDGIIAMIDAAMVEMKNIHPPLRRSECERLIRAAIAAKEQS